jgi:mannose-6-phosphate isomerase-like protein (cupin superfamily)
MSDSNHTVVNLQDVEDQAPGFGMSPGMDARFARKQLGLQNSGFSRIKFAPNYRTPFGHAHSEQEELYLVVAGSARVKLDDEVVDLKTWDALRIAPGVMRCVEGGPTGAEVILFGAPNTENKDIEMVQRWWAD